MNKTDSKAFLRNPIYTNSAVRLAVYSSSGECVRVGLFVCWGVMEATAPGKKLFLSLLVCVW